MDKAKRARTAETPKQPSLGLKFARAVSLSRPRELVTASEVNRRASDREAGVKGSGERNCRPMNRNRIEGGAEQGERAGDREALVTKARRRRSGRSCREGLMFLPWGRSRLAPERATRAARPSTREVSRGAMVAVV